MIALLKGYFTSRTFYIKLSLCFNDDSATKLLNGHIYLLNELTDPTIFASMINFCICSNYYKSTIVLFQNCNPEFYMNNIHGTEIHPYIKLMIEIMTEDELIKIYVDNKGKGFFTTDYYWIFHLLQSNKITKFLMFLLKHGHHNIDNMHRYDAIDICGILLLNDNRHQIIEIFNKYDEDVFNNSLRSTFINACII